MVFDLDNVVRNIKKWNNVIFFLVCISVFFQLLHYFMQINVLIAKHREIFQLLEKDIIIIGLNTLLTTTSWSGSCVPEISSGFLYWQPAPRRRLLQWLANSSNPAMSPHAKPWRPRPRE